MHLGCRILDNVVDVNTFDHADSSEWVEGDTVTLYLQLVDESKDSYLKGFHPGGRRYMPATGATLEVTLDSIDDALRVVRAANQPFPTTDPSIWAVPILTTDTVRGTVNLRLTLTEGDDLHSAFLLSKVHVTTLDRV